jgi:hypothetical protein
MDQFDVVKMANGGFALVLETTSTWEEFPAYAEKWRVRLNAKSLSKPVVTFDECVAEVAISGGVCFDPISPDDSTEVIAENFERLLELCEVV